MPLGRDRRRVEVVYVTGLDPAMLPEGIVDPILIVPVSSCVAADEGSEFKWVVPVLNREIERRFYD